MRHLGKNALSANEIAQKERVNEIMAEHGEPIEARRDLQFTIMSTDWSVAVQKSFFCCGAAVAARRALSSELAVFYKTIAYVQHPDDDEQMKVFRYVLPQATQNIIAAFDRGEKMTGSTITLSATRPAVHRKTASEYRRALRLAGKMQKEGENAHVVRRNNKFSVETLPKGAPAPTSAWRGIKRPVRKQARPAVYDTSVRSGMGQVHPMLTIP